MLARIAIIRTSAAPVSRQFYNVQEIGLATALTTYGISSDIYMADSGCLQPQVESIPVQPGTVRLIRWPVRFRLPHNHCILENVSQTVDTQAYDLIQIQDSYSIGSVQTAVTLRRRVGIPIVLQQGVYLHPHPGRQLVQYAFELTLGRLLRRSVSACLVKTPEAAAYLERFGYPASTVVPVGLDTSPFDQAVEPRDVRGEFGIPSTALLLLYVGKIEARRRVDFAIQVCRGLRDGGTDAHLLVVGRGPTRVACDRLVRSLGLASAIHFAGDVPQVHLRSYYNAADFLIHPSRHEILGMTLMESLYHGLPVITSNTPGAASIIQHNHQGLILPTWNAGEWVEGIGRLWRDGSRHAEMREAARARIEIFRWSALAQHYARFYSGVIDRAGQKPGREVSFAL